MPCGFGPGAFWDLFSLKKEIADRDSKVKQKQESQLSGIAIPFPHIPTYIQYSIVLPMMGPR
jgi:hypothetical protein